MNVEHQMQENHARSTDKVRSDRGYRPLAVFWDMDGTLIDSEPYWHQAEVDLAQEHGGDWNADMGWQVSGSPLPEVARLMRDRGLDVPADQIPGLLIDGVIAMEARHMPWIDGVRDVLASLVQAGIPRFWSLHRHAAWLRLWWPRRPKGLSLIMFAGTTGWRRSLIPRPICMQPVCWASTNLLRWPPVWLLRIP